MKKYQKRKALEQLRPAETSKSLLLVSTTLVQYVLNLLSPVASQHANSMVTMIVTTWIPVLLLLPHNMTVNGYPDSLCLHFLLCSRRVIMVLT